MYKALFSIKNLFSFSYKASAQQQLALVAEKERSAVDFAMEMKSRLAALELQVSSLRKQKEEVNNELIECRDSSRIVEEKLEKLVLNTCAIKH